MMQIEQLYETIELHKFLMSLESRSEIIVSFLAVLELLKLNRYYLDTVEPLTLRRKVS
jgi:segregation and condensation protein A